MPFRDAVDWKALGLFDYPRVISKPMDLGLVRRNVDENRYKSVFDAAEDVRLIWKNCMTYNPPGTEFYSLAEKLSKKFEEKYSKLAASMNGGRPSISKTSITTTSRRKSAREASQNSSSSDEDGTRNNKKRTAGRSAPASAQRRIPSIKLRVNFNRNAKRHRNEFKEELDDETDEDDLMTSGEEEEVEKRRKKRLAKKKSKSLEPAEGENSECAISPMGEGKEDFVDETDRLVMYEVEAPPPGQLHCLWYSREVFLHVFALEKVLGWKTRPVVKLERCETDKPETGEFNAASALQKANDKLHSIDFDDATHIKENAIADTGNDFRKRREISRINPVHCPTIKKLAADRELESCKNDGSAPKFKIVTYAREREEVFLVKWRGRSYMHCSWERQCDLEKYDQSGQQGAARGKISRFVQNQVMSLGQNWKKVLEDDRRAQAAPPAHTHHSHTHPASFGVGNSVNSSNSIACDDDVDDEEYFPPLYLEVDRIVGCDENKLDMNILARQRALNLRAEREALKQREMDDDEEEKWLKGEHNENSNGVAVREGKLKSSDTALDKKEEEWDPEDNVRYIVRWKGLQLTEATWEYWADIKRDFVNEVEDFWLRQRAPSPEEVEEMSIERQPHPRSFKKLNESPIFGISNVKRPIAKLDGEDEDNETPSEPVDESVLKLRAYQLEGVNWLLWNWYNRRSCILADEMGLGKTIQSIGFLHGLQRLPKVNIRGPFLIVAPLSLVSQWESETKEWAPDFNVVVYHGSADARDFLVKNEFFYTDQFESKGTAQNLRRKHITKFQLLITTYEVVLKDVNVLAKIR